MGLRVTMPTKTKGVARGKQKTPPLMMAAGSVPPAPLPPKTLKVQGRLWWVAIWAGGARWLDPASDLLIVEQVCVTLDQATAIEIDLAKNGRYYLSPQGHELARPGVGDARALRAQVVSWLALLGFTPSARAEMNVAVVVADDLAGWRRKNNRVREVNQNQPVKQW